MKKVLLVGLALSVVLFGNSYAQETPIATETTLTPVLEGNNQYIDETIIQIVLQDADAKFSLIDVNGNDEISRGEYINFSLREQDSKQTEADDDMRYDEYFYSAMFDDIDEEEKGFVSREEYISKQVKDTLGEHVYNQLIELQNSQVSEDVYEQDAYEQAQIEEQERIKAEEERVRKEEEAVRKAEQEAIEAEEEMMRMKEEMAANYDDGYEVVTRRRRR